MFDVGQLLREAASTEAARLRASLGRLATSVMLAMVAGLVAIIGVVFLLVGAYQSLNHTLPPWQAGGLVAVALRPVIALLLAGRLALRSRGDSRQRRQHSGEGLRAAAGQGRRAGEAMRHAGLRPVDLMLAAFVAGLATARSRRSRSRSRADDAARP